MPLLSVGWSSVKLPAELAPSGVTLAVIALAGGGRGREDGRGVASGWRIDDVDTGAAVGRNRPTGAGKIASQIEGLNRRVAR
jgi:hypothetical protein